MEQTKNNRCSGRTIVFSRTVGYFAPISQMNKGMRASYNDRLNYDPKKVEDKPDDEK